MPTTIPTTGKKPFNEWKRTPEQIAKSKEACRNSRKNYEERKVKLRGHAASLTEGIQRLREMITETEKMLSDLHSELAEEERELRLTNYKTRS